MRTIYDPQDMKPGTLFGKVGIVERWMVGYDPSKGNAEKYLLVSTSDGMVAITGGADDVAACLNRGNYLPAEVLDNPRRKQS